jgi:hypothetical protein
MVTSASDQDGSRHVAVVGEARANDPHSWPGGADEAPPRARRKPGRTRQRPAPAAIANGTPITKKRYEVLWRRLGEHLAWVETLQVSMYWIRHTILTWVERNFGFAVAEAYAGHEDNGRDHAPWAHGHLRPGRPARGGDRPRPPHRRTPPVGHQRPRHRPRHRIPAFILARPAARTAYAGSHPHPSLRPPGIQRRRHL